MDTETYAFTEIRCALAQFILCLDWLCLSCPSFLQVFIFSCASETSGWVIWSRFNLLCWSHDYNNVWYFLIFFVVIYTYNVLLHVYYFWDVELMKLDFLSSGQLCWSLKKHLLKKSVLIWLFYIGKNSVAVLTILSLSYMLEYVNILFSVLGEK